MSTGPIFPRDPHAAAHAADEHAPNDAPSDTLLARYWFGQASAEEATQVETWFAAVPGRRERYTRLRHLMLGAGPAELSDRDVTRRTAAILDTIQSDTSTSRPRPSAGEPAVARATSRNMRESVVTRASAGRSSRARFPWRATIAGATLACAAGVVGIIALHSTRTSGSSRTDRIYATRTGQRATVMLSDGSRVQLAPQTTLRVASNFGRGDRVVTLSGEAYFAVSHVTGAPFTVRTGATLTRVVGTTFDVQRYPTDHVVRVTVTAGKVVVGGTTPRQPSVTLIAGMTGVVSDSSAVTVATGELPTVSWTDGQLVFHNATTDDVLAALTRWYGYRFRLTDSSLVHQNLTMGVSTESSAAALETLKQVLDVDLTFHDSVVTVSPRRDASAHATPRNPRGLRGIYGIKNPFSTTHAEVGR
jgi:ferric-dicitrate binding protein FerR (iron transport regulator)